MRFGESLAAPRRWPAADSLPCHRSDQSLSDLESLVARIVAARWAVRAPIPIVGIRKIALDAMQPSMDPSSLHVVLGLGEFVRGVPIAALAMPDGAILSRLSCLGSAIATPLQHVLGAG